MATPASTRAIRWDRSAARAWCRQVLRAACFPDPGSTPAGPRRPSTRFWPRRRLRPSLSRRRPRPWPTLNRSARLGFASQLSQLSYCQEVVYRLLLVAYLNMPMCSVKLMELFITYSQLDFQYELMFRQVSVLQSYLR